MAKCPRCDHEIGVSRVCDCGWRSRVGRPSFDSQPQAVHVDCAHATCNQPSIAKIQTANGWKNLCNMHYDKHFRDEANANLDKYGLARMADETQAEHVLRMRAFVKAGFKGFSTKSMAYAVKREPNWESADLKALVRDYSTDAGMEP